MEYTFSQQSTAFLYSFLLGVALWLFYEVLKTVRITFNISGKKLFFCDLLFMVTSCFATFLFALGFLNGSVRFYMIFGELTAFIILHISIGKIINRYLTAIILFAKRIIIRIINLFKKIIKKLLKILYKVLYNMFEKIYKFVSFFKNVLSLSILNKKGNKYGKQKERISEKNKRFAVFHKRS